MSCMTHFYYLHIQVFYLAMGFGLQNGESIGFKINAFNCFSGLFCVHSTALIIGIAKQIQTELKLRSSIHYTITTDTVG